MEVYLFIALLALLVIALLVVPLFTNKKRAKETEKLHRSLMPGDVVKTVGGVIGTIKEIRYVSSTDQEMIIETGDGDNTSTMTFDIQALYMVLNRAITTVPVVSNNSASEHKSEPDEQPASRDVPPILADRVAEENAETPAEAAETETAATEPQHDPEVVETAEEKTEAPAEVAEAAETAPQQESEPAEAADKKAEEPEKKPATKKPAQKKTGGSAKKKSK